MMGVQPIEQTKRRNRRTLFACVGAVCGMVALSFASVPLYQLFCAVTGYGGTTRVAAEKSASVTTRDMRVRFDASTSQDLPWRFQPVQREVRLKVGENALAFYRARNMSEENITGVATFNVTPQKVGRYFNKIDCFCFSEQTLKPGESVDMPVTFFVDPSISDDPNLDDVKTITLSYTFFVAPSDEPDAKKPVAGETPHKVVAERPIGNSRRIN
ncbi:MAG: cytochrome c oxidase assembly protein [Rhodospirillaceae bacterium]|nr:cytochrome c oxidase assembly protein [Rhodospirillaceae bacterium]